MELVHYGDVESMVYDSIAHAYKRDMYTYINLIHRPSHPIVCCSINTGEDLVFGGNVPLLDTSAHHPGTSLHVISFTASKWMHCRPQTRAIGNLGNVSWVQKATLQLYRRNVPLLHKSTQHTGTSLHMIGFTKPSPCYCK